MVMLCNCTSGAERIMNLDEARTAYNLECHKLGKVPLLVASLTYDRISEQYTLSNSKDGDFADLDAGGKVLRMHWNTTG